MRASHVEKKGLFAARDRKCRASLIIGCTTTTILERLSFRHRIPFRLSLGHSPFSSSRSSSQPRRKRIPLRLLKRRASAPEWNRSEWNGKSTTRPGSRVEELERLDAPGITSSTSDCLSGKRELQVDGMDGYCLWMKCRKVW